MKDDINILWWSWINVISDDDSLLSKKGLIIKRLIEKSGECESKIKLSKLANYKCIGIFNKDCNDLIKANYICIEERKRNKKILFSNNFIQKGNRLRSIIIK